MKATDPNFDRLALRYTAVCIVLFSFFLASCGTEYKDVGNRTTDEFNLDLDTDESSTNYRLAFGLRATETATAIEVQAVANSSSTFVEICGNAGTNCRCEFSTTALEEVNFENSSNVTYSSSLNFFKCDMPSSITDPTQYKFVRINSLGGGQATPIVRIHEEDQGSNTIEGLDLGTLITGLDAAKVRNIYNYKCRFNFIQSPNFTATTGTLSCAVAGVNDFVGITAPFTYYMYSDKLTNNLGSRLADFPYANGNLCTLAARQINCNQTLDDEDGTPNPNRLDFGLYAAESGIFDVRVSATSAPVLLGGVSEVYGYAANTDSSGDCPPFLEKRQLYTATVPASPDDGGGLWIGGYLSANSNYDATQSDSIIATTNPGNLEVRVYNNGLCTTGTDCDRFPSISTVGNKISTTTSAFAQSGGDFCVIPSSILVE